MSLTPTEIRRRRYQRHYARNAPVIVTSKALAAPVRDKRLVIPGFIQWMQQVVRMQFGAPGTWGHGRYQHATRKGPGRRPLARIARIRPAGSKLVKRFIRDATGENVEYRRLYQELTGKEYA